MSPLTILTLAAVTAATIAASIQVAGG
jgi:hypothetical protein